MPVLRKPDRRERIVVFVWAVVRKRLAGAAWFLDEGYSDKVILEEVSTLCLCEYLEYPGKRAYWWYSREPENRGSFHFAGSMTDQKGERPFLARYRALFFWRGFTRRRPLCDLPGCSFLYRDSPSSKIQKQIWGMIPESIRDHHSLGLVIWIWPGKKSQ
jgi:hypothetical protein